MFLNPLDILQAKFGLDDFHVTDRVDIALDVDDIGVIERPDNLENTIYRTDMR